MTGPLTSARCSVTPAERRDWASPGERFERAQVDSIDAARDQHQMLEPGFVHHPLHDRLLQVGGVGEGQVLVYPQQQDLGPGLELVVAPDVAEMLAPR